MEIVQTGTDTWRWCMSMFGARFAVFVRRARVLPTLCPATRNLSFLRFHRRRHLSLQRVVSTRLVRGCLTRVLYGYRANVYGHVAAAHRLFGARVAVVFTFVALRSLRVPYDVPGRCGRPRSSSTQREFQLRFGNLFLT